MQTDLHNGDNAGLVLDDPTPKTPLLGPLLWRASQEVQDICATLGIEPGPPIEVESDHGQRCFGKGGAIQDICQIKRLPWKNHVIR